MALVYMGLGSNLGDKKKNIQSAIQALGKTIGGLVKCSSLYETAPWGFSSGHLFLNAAAIFRTELSPLEILDETERIERSLGRKEKSHNSQYTDRIIDIDILLYDQLVMKNGRIILPHPHLHERMFVLAPLEEIAPEAEHPILHHTIRELKSSLAQEQD